MAFLRPAHDAAREAALETRALYLRPPQMRDWCAWAELRGALARVPQPLGADMAVRRAHPQRLPPAHPPPAQGRPGRYRLRLLPLPPLGRRAARRHDARQRAAQRGAVLQRRLLDRPASRQAGPYERGAGRPARPLLRAARAASRRGRVHAGQQREPEAAGEDRVPLARATPAPISGSPAPGATICCTRRSRRATGPWTAATAAAEPGAARAAAPVQARPATPERLPGSMPSRPTARSHLASSAPSKTSSSSAGTVSQPFSWISRSSWPGAQPA